MPDLMRHITNCRNVNLPGDRVPFLVNASLVGWLKPDFIERLLRFAPLVQQTSEGVALNQSQALAQMARELAEEGWFRWRDEAFDVRTAEGPILTQIDRGALPAFGAMTHGVHLNGLVQRPDGLHVWVSRRADDRPLDPGKLDHLAAGGVPAGLSEWQTLLKEAAEEASLPTSLTSQARLVGQITYTMERAEGLRRDRLFCFDLLLPEDFIPKPQDDEIVGFELWPLSKVIATVTETDDFKFNVNLVLIDLFLRNGLNDPGGRLRSRLSEQ